MRRAIRGFWPRLRKRVAIPLSPKKKRFARWRTSVLTICLKQAKQKAILLLPASRTTISGPRLHRITQTKGNSDNSTPVSGRARPHGSHAALREGGKILCKRDIYAPVG